MTSEGALAAGNELLFQALIAQGCSVEKALRIAQRSSAAHETTPEWRDEPKGFIAGR